MSKRLNLKDKMEEINDKFALKNKSSLANDVLENKLKYFLSDPVISKRNSQHSLAKMNRKWQLSRQKHYNCWKDWSR